MPLNAVCWYRSTDFDCSRVSTLDVAALHPEDHCHEWREDYVAEAGIVEGPLGQEGSDNSGHPFEFQWWRGNRAASCLARTVFAPYLYSRTGPGQLTLTSMDA